MTRLGLKGLVKLDFKRADDETLHLLEVNPRFSLWHHLGAVAGVNLWVELACLDDALRATPDGLGDLKSKAVARVPPAEQEGHCSAFAATGPATAPARRPRSTPSTG